MVTLKSVVVLALAGTTLAVPFPDWKWKGYGRWKGNWGWDNNSNSVSSNSNEATYTYTVYVTKGRPTATATATASAAPTATPTPDTGDDDDNSGDDSGDENTPSTGDYMDIVTKWRKAGGLAPLQRSTQLEANAQKTARDGNGQMEHELNPGTMGQVLAPGTPDLKSFESVYVGGWLCERPGLAGLNGVCGSMAQGWAHNGQTGHADILTSSSYSKIGCGCITGIWACDLA